MAVKSELKWHTLAVADLSKEEQGACSKMKEAYKAYVAFREAFEDIVAPSVRLTLDASANEEVKFGYRYGFDNIGVALAPVTVRKGKNVLTLKRK